MVRLKRAKRASFVEVIFLSLSVNQGKVLFFSDEHLVRADDHAAP